MSPKTVLSLVPIAIVVGLASAAGCSSTAATPAPADGGSAAADARPADTGVRDTGVTSNDSGAGGCYDASKATKLAATSAKSKQNLCTGTQIGNFYTSCLGPGVTEAGCKAFIEASANNACVSCLEGAPVGDAGTTANFPVLLHANEKFTAVNTDLCAYLTIAKPECVANAVNLSQCRLSACGACPLGSSAPADQSLILACQDAADADVCKDTMETKACTDAFTAGKAAITSACLGGTFQDVYTKVATLICGP